MSGELRGMLTAYYVARSHRNRFHDDMREKHRKVKERDKAAGFGKHSPPAALLASIYGN